MIVSTASGAPTTAPAASLGFQPTVPATTVPAAATPAGTAAEPICRLLVVPALNAISILTLALSMIEPAGTAPIGLPSAELNSALSKVTDRRRYWTPASSGCAAGLVKYVPIL